MMEEASPSRRASRLWLLPAALVVVCGLAVLGWEQRGAMWLMPAVAARIEAASGLRFAAEGRVSVRLFPRIGVHAAGVKLVPDQGSGARPMVYADAADVDLSWARLLHGEFRIRHLHLARTRLLVEPLQPPVDVDIAVVPAGIEAILSSAGAEARVTGHLEGDTLALDHLELGLPELGLAAAGSGRLSLRDPVRLVLNTALRRGAVQLGAAAVAVSYAEDGLVLERANWRRPDGLDVSVFGHAAPADATLRFEGGLGASSEKDKRFDAAAEFDGTFGGDGLRVALTSINVRTGVSRLTGSARIRSGKPVQATASLQLDRLDLSEIRRLPLAQLAADLAETGLNVEAGLHMRIGTLATSGKTIADGIVIDASRRAGSIELHELAARSLAGLPFRARGRVAFGPAMVVVLDPIRASYGSIDAAGRLRLDVSGLRPSLAGDLATGPLQLDTVLAGPPPLPAEPMTRRELAAAKEKARRPGLAAWPDKPLAVPASLPFDADLAFASPRVAWHRYRLDDVHANLGVRQHQLTVTGLNAALFGGKLAFSGRVDDADPPHVAAKLQVLGADLGAILADAGFTNIVAHGDVAADLTADGRSVAALVNTLAGNVTVAARDGTIRGVDMPMLSARLKQPQHRPADIIQLARIAAGGETPFSALHGRFRIDRGVARTDDLQLAATDAAARIRGSIDLPRRSLDLVNEFQVTDPPAVPPLVIKLEGSLTAPRRVFDISRLQSYLLRKPRPSPAR